MTGFATRVDYSKAPNRKKSDEQESICGLYLHQSGILQER
ncbi:hypothetical protein LINGRAPRIM_LOCUS2749, partial [Linum grandiflorum]